MPGEEVNRAGGGGCPGLAKGCVSGLAAQVVVSVINVDHLV